MSRFVSAEKPFTYNWLIQHMAYDRGRQDANMDEAVGRDADETRRLLYMALYAHRTDRYNLVGTLVNALAHHGSGLDPDEVAEHVLEAVNGGDQAWVREQIARLTAETDDQS